MQVIGLCRFSYPAFGGFQVEHETIEDRVAFLYNETRLEERFRLFEAVALPGLKAQTDPDFQFIILIGTSLPDRHRVRLQGLIEDFPQARILAAPPAPHRAVMKQVINATCGDMEVPSLQFRHDDDDAVAIDFVARLRQAAEDCRGLLQRNPTTAIDFSSGYTAAFSDLGILAAESYRPWTTAGLAMYSGPNVKHTIMNFGHHKIARHMPSVAYNGPRTWIRGHNEYNDSRQKRGIKPVFMDPLTDAQEAEFQERFRISSANVREVFSAP